MGNILGTSENSNYANTDAELCTQVIDSLVVSAEGESHLVV